jgi:hypothetical protein
MPRVPHFGGANDKLFGDNQTFTATMELQMKNSNGETITMPGTFAFDSGKSRFEADMTKMAGSRMPEGGAEQMKQMGMDTIVMIGRPDKKTSYLIYPSFQSYIENPLQDSQSAKSTNDFKIETTELGKESVDGHSCVKNKVIVTEKDGTKHESTVWNATDLKKFPVKIQTVEAGNDVTMLFKDVKTAKPDATSFNPPSDYQKYDDQMELMRDQVMKRMGGGMGMPPGMQPPR